MHADGDELLFPHSTIPYLQDACHRLAEKDVFEGNADFASLLR